MDEDRKEKARRLAEKLYIDLVPRYTPLGLEKTTPEQLAKSREGLHDMFAAKNWALLDYDARCTAVQLLERDLAFQQGRPAREVRVEPLKDNTYGEWRPETKCIFLNKNLLEKGTLSNASDAVPLEDANLQIFDTIAHEGYHAYQSYALENPEAHENKQQLREWALNEGRYYPSGDKEYLIQPQERDAWRYGSEATENAFQGIEARNGPQPGMQEYRNMVAMNSYEMALNRAQRQDPNVLKTMENEMKAGCEQRGIFYDHTGEEQAAQQENAFGQRPAPQQEQPFEQEQLFGQEQPLGQERPFQMDETVQQEQPYQQTLASDGFSMDQMTPFSPVQDQGQNLEQGQEFTVNEQMFPMDQMTPFSPTQDQDQGQEIAAPDQMFSMDALTQNAAEPQLSSDMSLSGDMSLSQDMSRAEAPEQESGLSMDSLTPEPENAPSSSEDQEQEKQQSYGYGQ